MTIMERTSYISGKVLLRTNTGCCPLVVLLSACCPLDVRLLSAFKADNKRTSSGQQADNKRCWSLLGAWKGGRGP